MKIELSKEEVVAVLKAFGEYKFATRCCGGDVESESFALVGVVEARMELALASEVEREGSTYRYGIGFAFAASQAGWREASDRILYPYALGKREVA